MAETADDAELLEGVSSVLAAMVADVLDDDDLIGVTDEMLYHDVEQYRRRVNAEMVAALAPTVAEMITNHAAEMVAACAPTEWFVHAQHRDDFAYRDGGFHLHYRTPGHPEQRYHPSKGDTPLYVKMAVRPVVGVVR